MKKHYKRKKKKVILLPLKPIAITAVRCNSFFLEFLPFSELLAPSWYFSAVMLTLYIDCLLSRQQEGKIKTGKNLNSVWVPPVYVEYGQFSVCGHHF